ncbi:hypothetical protein H0O00_02085 [Candidatus Micrarchaeota archaeon]|nr:hypothetical protein [Candidatus Micrarchaeota archaeon]
MDLCRNMLFSDNPFSLQVTYDDTQCVQKIILSKIGNGTVDCAEMASQTMHVSENEEFCLSTLMDKTKNAEICERIYPHDNDLGWCIARAIWDWGEDARCGSFANQTYQELCENARTALRENGCRDFPCIAAFSQNPDYCHYGGYSSYEQCVMDAITMGSISRCDDYALLEGNKACCVLYALSRNETDCMAIEDLNLSSMCNASTALRSKLDPSGQNISDIWGGRYCWAVLLGKDCFEQDLVVSSVYYDPGICTTMNTKDEFFCVYSYDPQSCVMGFDLLYGNQTTNATETGD